MWKKLIIPVTAAMALLFAVTHVVRSQQPPPPKSLQVEPPHSPYARTIAAAGLIEARSDASDTANTSVGSELPGVVAKVAVKVGQPVKAGDILFELDDRQLRAELRVKEANLAAARAQLARLEQMPRPEELPAAEARLREAEANLKSASDLAVRAEKLVKSFSIGEEETYNRRQAQAAADAKRAEAQANLDLVRAGAWTADKAVTRAAVAQAEAQVQQTLTDLDRRAPRAPIDATVLKVNVRPGEFVGTPPNQPLVVLGNLEQLQVRVDVDENDIHRFHSQGRAVAKLRGDPSQEFPLRFVRVEPYVVPKRALTGDNTERVDTRVLQVIYTIDSLGKTLYVGQQVDVFQDGAR